MSWRKQTSNRTTVIQSTLHLRMLLKLTKWRRIVEQRESLKWTLTNKGVLSHSGNGAMPNYSPNDDKFPSWSTYGDKINTVVIENGVTSVGDYAFYGSKALALYLLTLSRVSVKVHFIILELLANATIPSSVETIGNSAFRLCKGELYIG